MGLDGWVNQWLEIWRPNNKSAIKFLNYAIRNLTSSRAWKKYATVKNKDLWYIKDDLISTLGMFNFTVSTSTSFAIAGMGGFSKLSSNKTFIQGSLNFLDWCSGKKFINNKGIPMWFLDTISGNILDQCNYKSISNFNNKSIDNILNSANMLQGLVYDNEIMRSLYNGSLMNSAYQDPHIISISSNKIAIRLAKYRSINNYGELLIILSSMNKLNHYISININITKNYNIVRCKLYRNDFNCIYEYGSVVKCYINIRSYYDRYIKLCFTSIK